MNSRTKTLTTLAMMTAISFALVAFIRIPLFPAAAFLTYEPKDVVIVIAGFIFGPAAAAAVTVVVALIEFLTISSTGFWGLLMNILSSASFAVVASLIYHKNHTLKGAVIGLVCGVVSMTIMMVLWNYICTPIYMGVPRPVVAGMLPTVFAPFNAIKGALNASWTILLYKPIITALRKAGLIQASRSGEKFRMNIGLLIIAAVIIVGIALFACISMGVF